MPHGAGVGRGEKTTDEPDYDNGWRGDNARSSNWWEEDENSEWRRGWYEALKYEKGRGKWEI